MQNQAKHKIEKTEEEKIKIWQNIEINLFDILNNKKTRFFCSAQPQPVLPVTGY